MYPIRITELAPREVVGRVHNGPYTRIGTTFDRMSAALGAAGLWPQVAAMIAVYHHDPAVVAARNLRSLAAVELRRGAAAPMGFVTQALPMGRHGVLRVTGPYTGLAAAYDWLYGTWLPRSGEVPREAPCHEIYVTPPGTTPPDDLITDIHLPLQDARQ